MRNNSFKKGFIRQILGKYFKVYCVLFIKKNLYLYHEQCDLKRVKNIQRKLFIAKMATLMFENDRFCFKMTSGQSETDDKSDGNK